MICAFTRKGKDNELELMLKGCEHIGCSGLHYNHSSGRDHVNPISGDVGNPFCGFVVSFFFCCGGAFKKKKTFEENCLYCK